MKPNVKKKTNRRNSKIKSRMSKSASLPGSQKTQLVSSFNLTILKLPPKPRLSPKKWARRKPSASKRKKRVSKNSRRPNKPSKTKRSLKSAKKRHLNSRKF
jgi:hypothetical protein